MSAMSAVEPMYLVRPCFMASWGLQLAVVYGPAGVRPDNRVLP